MSTEDFSLGEKLPKHEADHLPPSRRSAQSNRGTTLSLPYYSKYSKVLHNAVWNFSAKATGFFKGKVVPVLD
jgi:hypothetical protein